MRSLYDYLGGVFFFLACLFLLVPCAQAGEVTLSWDPNAEIDIAGYKIYVGLESRRYDAVIDAGNNTSCVVSGLEQGRTYYFAATAYNDKNLESDFSNEVMKTLSLENADSTTYVDPTQSVEESEIITSDGSTLDDESGQTNETPESDFSNEVMITSSSENEDPSNYVDPAQSVEESEIITSDGSIETQDGVNLLGEWLSIRKSFAGKSNNCFVEGRLLVQNDGNQWADSSLLYVYESNDPSVLEFYESTDWEWDELEAYLGSATILGSAAIPALEAGQSVDVSFKFKSYATMYPIYFIAVLDATYLLDDIDRNDNFVLLEAVK
jgi:hypothetical protein